MLHWSLICVSLDIKETLDVYIRSLTFLTMNFAPWLIIDRDWVSRTSPGCSQSTSNKQCIWCLNRFSLCQNREDREVLHQHANILNLCSDMVGTAHSTKLRNTLDDPKKMLPSKRFYLFRNLVENAKWWSKSNLPRSLTLRLQNCSLKKGF